MPYVIPPQPKIIRNACRCKHCKTVLESAHRHDYKECACGVMVDGGRAYIRRGWPGGSPEDWIEELTQYEPPPPPPEEVNRKTPK